LIINLGIDKGGSNNQQNDSDHPQGGFDLKELLPQENNSKRLVKIHLEFFSSNVHLDVLDTIIKLMTSLQSVLK
jgi:hypothetical protein